MDTNMLFPLFSFASGPSVLVIVVSHVAWFSVAFFVTDVSVSVFV